MKYIFKYGWLFCCFLSAKVYAQSINLDRPVKAGELICFPDINNANNYYYISDKPSLAIGTNGKPQFSFLRYIRNSKSTTDQGKTVGEGGGIVHAVVSLAVSPDQLEEAKQQIKQAYPNANLIGPVMYQSGTFGIVSSFKDPEGGLSKQVLGIGKAPILDGQKAAISMQLTHQGSEILWESFKTTTPDISFTFEMDLAGYRSPKNAVIEANFDQVYEHKSFQAGVAMSFIAAEIKMAFDDLIRSGAIKVTQVGEDEKMDAMITTAYNKIAEMMFSPMNGTGDLGLEQLGGITGGSSPSVLDRATNLLKSSREEANATNRSNQQRRDAANNSTANTSTSSNRPTTPSTADSSRTDSASRQRPTPYSGTQPAVVSEQSHTSTVSPNAPPSSENNNQNNIQDVAVPTFAVVATFEMKKVRQQGIFRIDLNKSTADKVTMRFDENIGDLTRYMSDNAVFRQVNLDDPFYKQRELTVKLDGTNIQDFGQYVNFVNLRIKKNHENGEVTTDEVRIDRDNFNREGNLFRLLYGWKGDNDRNRWFDYEYETEWNFFGGQSVKEALQPNSANSISVFPPYQRRSVEFQADSITLANAGVRLVTATVYYMLGSSTQKKQVTLNPARGQLSEKVEFMLPADSYDYEYEITWRLSNNQSRSSGRLRSNESILFADFIN